MKWPRHLATQILTKPKQDRETELAKVENEFQSLVRAYLDIYDMRVKEFANRVLREPSLRIRREILQRVPGEKMREEVKQIVAERFEERKRK